MTLKGECASLRARDGYADAAATSDGEMAALELEIVGDLRVYEREGERRQVLTLDFAGGREHMRRIGLLLLEKSGAPVFTETEWLDIALALERASHEAVGDHRPRLESYAAKIREAYAQ
jgi:hypothetical protein